MKVSEVVGSYIVLVLDSVGTGLLIGTIGCHFDVVSRQYLI